MVPGSRAQLRTRPGKHAFAALLLQRLKLIILRLGPACAGGSVVVQRDRSLAECQRSDLAGHDRSKAQRVEAEDPSARIIHGALGKERHGENAEEGKVPGRERMPQVAVAAG